MFTPQFNANGPLMDEALHDAYRFDNGEMSLRESLEFFQALLDANLVHAMPAHIQTRVRWVRSMGMLRGDGGAAATVDVAREPDSLGVAEHGDTIDDAAGFGSYGDYAVPPTAADDAESAVCLLWRWGRGA